MTLYIASAGAAHSSTVQRSEGGDACRATGPTEGDNEPYIYKKGPAFGMPGVLVDGMDVMKVWLLHNTLPMSGAL